MGFHATVRQIAELCGRLENEHDKEVERLQSHISVQQGVLDKAGLQATVAAEMALIAEPEVPLKRHGHETADESTNHPTSGRESEFSMIQDDTTEQNAELRVTDSFSETSDRSRDAFAAAEDRVNEVVKRTMTRTQAFTAFEIHGGWLKAPAASGSFLDEADAVLTRNSTRAMKIRHDLGFRDSCSSTSIGGFGVSHVVEKIGVLVPKRMRPTSLLIHPGSLPRLFWDLSGTCLIGYDMVAIPVHLSFEPEDNWFSIFMGWLTLVFWSMDMVFSMLTGYYSGGLLVMRHRDIIVNYLKFWFWVDCIVVVPDWVMKSMGTMSNAAGLGRAFRVARVFRVLRLLRLLKLKRLFDILYDLIDSEVAFIMFGLVKLLIIIIFMNHLVACAWYFVGRLTKDMGADRNWLQDVGMWPVWGQDLSWKYLTSLHWSITQFTPASMDIYATNSGERLFSVVILFFALVSLSSIIGSVSASMTALRNMSADENKQFWILRRYLRQHAISRKLVGRIMNYVEFQHIKTQHAVAADGVKLLSTLSETFRLEMAHELFAPYLVNHPFFTYLANDGTMLKSLQRLCSSALKVVAGAMDEYVYALGDEGTKMFFVMNGSYEYTLLDGSRLDEPLTPKQWTSEAVLWTTWRHRGWLQAMEPSDTLTLDPSKFSEVLHLHPRPWYLAMQYGVDFVNFLNRIDPVALTDIIFDAEVWVSVIEESDTYLLKRPSQLTGNLSQSPRRIISTESIWTQDIYPAAVDQCVSQEVSTQKATSVLL